MNPVLIGLSPDFPPEDPRLYLARVTGLPAAVCTAKFDRMNLYEGWTPRTGDVEAGRSLSPSLHGRRVIALGPRVTNGLQLSKNAMEWDRYPDFVAASFPYPDVSWSSTYSPSELERGHDFFQTSLRPCIHIEGTDGAGKSTLVDAFVRSGFRKVETDNPPRSWEVCCQRVQSRILPGLVCDRSSGLVSELVYGPVIRGRSIVAEEVLWSVVRSIIHATTFIYCRPPKQEIRLTFREDEDPGHIASVKARGDELYDQYDLVMHRLEQIGGRVLYYDWTRQTPEEILRCVD